MFVFVVDADLSTDSCQRAPQSRRREKFWAIEECHGSDKFVKTKQKRAATAAGGAFVW